MAERKIITIDDARPIIQAKAKQFEAAMTSDPAAGRIRPVGFQGWMAAVFADFQRQPKLCEAAVQAPETVWECLNVAAGCGLVPGSAGGKFYLIPRWSGKLCRTECTFIVGYKGLAELAYRHPRVHKFEAFVVYKGEEFEFEPGRGRLTHTWRPDVDRSDENIVATYSRVVLTVPGGTHVDEEPLVCVMTKAEVDKIRKRSSADKAGFSPWVSDYAAMVRKTVMRRHANGGSIPQSADLIMALAAENREDDRLVAEVAPSATNVAAASLRSAVGIGDPGGSQSLARETETPREPEDLDREFEEHARRMPPAEDS